MHRFSASAKVLFVVGIVSIAHVYSQFSNDPLYQKHMQGMRDTLQDAPQSAFSECISKRERCQEAAWALEQAWQQASMFEFAANDVQVRIRSKRILLQAIEDFRKEVIAQNCNAVVKVEKEQLAITPEEQEEYEEETQPKTKFGKRVLVVLTKPLHK